MPNFDCFTASIAELDRGEKSHTQSTTHSPSLFAVPVTKAFALLNQLQPVLSNYCPTQETSNKLTHKMKSMRTHHFLSIHHRRLKTRGLISIPAGHRLHWQAIHSCSTSRHRHEVRTAFVGFMHSGSSFQTWFCAAKITIQFSTNLQSTLIYSYVYHKSQKFMT